MIDCTSLDEVRAQIDRIDHQLVRLLAERGGYVRQAVRFKRSPEEARAPARVEHVVAKVRRLAIDLDADPDLVEHVYRSMIARFIESELADLDRSR